MAKPETYTEEYIPVQSDSLDVVERLKEIDPSYFVLYNRRTERFELHSSAQQDSFCLEFPYPSIDARMIPYAQRCSTGNAAELYAEIDLENARREKELAEKRYARVYAEVEKIRRAEK